MNAKEIIVNGSQYYDDNQVKEIEGFMKQFALQVATEAVEESREGVKEHYKDITELITGQVLENIKQRLDADNNP